MSRTGFTRRLVTMGLAVMATASQNTGLSARAPAAPAESPTLKYYGAGSPTAEAQSWNEQSAREKSELLDVINPSPFALCSRALYLWLIFTPVGARRCWPKMSAQLEHTSALSCEHLYAYLSKRFTVLYLHICSQCIGVVYGPASVLV